jgi:DNA-binding transcriptional LysR family regulator
MVIFVEVGKRLNFTHAAEALNLPLSTLARRISLLETELGMRLVERTTRQLHLTSDGKRYFEHCQQFVDEALTAYDDVRAQASGLDGTLRIAGPSDLGARFMAGLIAQFLSQHPGLHIDLQLCPHEAASDRQVDLTIMIGEPGKHSLVARKVGAFGLGVYGSPAYIARTGMPLSKAELADHPLLICDPALPYWPNIEPSPKNINVTGRLRYDSFRLAASLAVEGMGLALLPQHLAANKLAAGSLTPILPDWTVGWVPLYIVTTSKLLPMRSRKFIAFATKHLRHSFSGAAAEVARDENGVLPES